MLGRALSRIMFFKETKKYTEAIAEINTAAPAILGLSMEMIERIPATGLKDVLGTDPALLHSKLYTAGVLLKEKGEVLELQQNSEESAEMYLKSLSFLVEDMPDLKDPDSEKEIRSIDFVIDRLNDFELPLGLKRRLVKYFESTGRYDRAENTVFEIVDEDDSYLEEGISFYERLLSKTDAELEDGGLPRSEVEESLAELRKKLTG